MLSVKILRGLLAVTIAFLVIMHNHSAAQTVSMSIKTFIFCVCVCPQEMLEALKALSVFFTENSLRTRRNLRGDIERRSLAINEEFAQIFKQVKEVTGLCKTVFDS